MRKDFKIALTAQLNGFIHLVASNLGHVTLFEGHSWPVDSDIIIFDCSAVKEDANEIHWQQVLRQNKTLGLVNMTEEHRAQFQRITGKTLHSSITGIFTRKSKEDAEKFTYTVIPDLDLATNHDAKQMASFLETRIFTADCCGGATPTGPGPAKNNIWPTGYNTYGSIQPMVTNMQFAINDVRGEPMSILLNATGYIFLANGLGQSPGDGRYHVFIISRMNNANPFVPDFNDPFGIYVSYGLNISTSRNGKPMQYPAVNANPTQPRLTNYPPPDPGIDLGDYICTYFGYSPSYQIIAQAYAQQVGSPLTPAFTWEPQYKQFVTQVSAPGIEAFGVIPIDTQISSYIQFDMRDDGGWTHSDNDTPVSCTQVGASSAPDQFVIVSYFDFAPPPNGATSFEVEFNFRVDFYLWMGSRWTGPDLYECSGTYTATIDLVKATQLSSTT